MNTIDIGAMGEDYAEQVLHDKGYIILERNFKCKHGEIDIIAKDEKTFVFVEVKTRQSTRYGNPSEAVNYFKQQRIMKSAFWYIKGKEVDMRFDVFEVLYKPLEDDIEVLEYNHIENAF